MSVQIKVFAKTEEVVNSGFADVVHDLFMASMVTDFADILTHLKESDVTDKLNDYAVKLEKFIESEGKPPIYLQESDMYVIAIEGENILGVATLCWEYDIASKGFRLANVFVVPSARRRGIATQLVNAAIECCDANETDYLSLNVAYHNKAAQALYAKYGFEPTRLNMIRKTQPKAEENVD